MTSERYYYSGQPAAYAPRSRYGGTMYRAQSGGSRGSAPRRPAGSSGRAPINRGGQPGGYRPE
ncbi:MAG: hypothetical protein IKE76_14590, partial [Clostridia bacterium]|nr:hypothetical protein [Clostridia bacterium]